MSKFVDTIVRTNKLHCSDCGDKIHKGDDVIFELEHGRLKNVYCEKCSEDYEQRAIEDSEHPFSSDALGQE